MPGCVQGSEFSDTRVHTQKTRWVFLGGPTQKPPVKPTPKNPPQLKSDFVLCATNKEEFYHFKCFKPMNKFIFLQLL